MSRIYEMKLLLIVLLATAVFAMKNPAAVYCQDMNYELIIQDGISYCQVSENIRFEAFEFYTGKIGQDYGYCRLHNLETSVVDEVQYCVMPNSTNISVDKLMGLDFEDFTFTDTGTCGDNFCSASEVTICPRDCEVPPESNPAEIHDKPATHLEQEDIHKPIVGQKGWIFGILGVLALGVVIFIRKMSRKANVMVVIMLIAGMMAILVMINQVTNQRPTAMHSNIEKWNREFDVAQRNIYSALEGAVLLGVRDYCLMGYSNDSAVWVEDIDLVPDLNERRDALFYHINKTIYERFQEFYVTADDDRYKIDPSKLSIELREKTYENGIIGYEIDVNDVKLSVSDPDGFALYNYSFSFPDIWLIYDGLKGYVESHRTEQLYQDINSLTSNTVCSDYQCQCGGSPLPGANSDVTSNTISISDVQSIIDDYMDGLRQEMQSKGIECEITDETSASNKLSTNIISSGSGYSCPAGLTVSMTGSSPDYLWVWSPEEDSYPGQPLPYQEPPTGLYDYSIVDRTGFSRHGSRTVPEVSVWPVRLESNGFPVQDSGSRADEKGADLVIHRLWRGVSSLIEIQCKDKNDLVLGADPNNPGKVGNLRARVFIRINTIAPCPMPIASINFRPWDAIVEATCPDHCWKTVCDTSTGTGGACIPDDTDAPDPTILPCQEPITVDLSCSECSARSDCACSFKPCGHCPTGEEEIEVTCPEPLEDPAGPPCYKTVDCCDGSCSDYGGNCIEDNQCSCETTEGENMVANNPVCKLITRCQTGATVCMCSCFLAGTMITMADGQLMPIEEVQLGDRVLGYNPESGEKLIGTVSELESPLREAYNEVELADGTLLKVTDEHPLYTRKQNWEGWASIDPKSLDRCSNMASVNLAVGDELFTLSGWSRVVRIERFDSVVQTYNLKTVIGSSTFFADGVLAHNEGKPSCFPAGNTVRMADGGLKPIEEVVVGDMVMSYDVHTGLQSEARVLEIESPVRDFYYDIRFIDGGFNVTNEHPLYVSNHEYKGWASINPAMTKEDTGMDVKKLAVGDNLQMSNGTKKIISISLVNKSVKTYNLKKISTSDSYYVSDAVAGTGDQAYYVSSVISAVKPSGPGPSGTTPRPPLPDQIDEW